MNPPAATESPSDPLPLNAARHPDGTLAAPEQPSVSSSSSSSSSSGSSSSNLATPAPPSRPSTLAIPNAPMQNPPAKGIPAATPASNATPVLKGLQAKQDGDQEKQEENVKVEERGVDVDMSPTGPSQTVAARPPSKRQVQASNNNRPTTPAAAPGSSTSTTRDQEASDKEKEPVFNFQGFLKDLKQKSAEPVARYLKSFLSNFVKKPFTVNEQIKLIHDFLAFISEKMVQVEPWKSQSSAEFDNALEAMEKLVMNRLYNYTFTPQLVTSQPITTDDLERDRVFSQRVRLFGWIREKQLDVPEGEAAQGFLGFAEQELLKINHYKAPRDKMICILNCCKVIFGLIRNVYGAESGGADAFIPILIFIVLRANPDNLISNLEYIQRFRSTPKLQGEAAYYLSSISGAIQFIETMDASSLSNITQAEFESNVESAIQALPPSPSAAAAAAAAAPARTSTTSFGGFRTPGRDEGRERDSKLISLSPFAATAPGDEAARPLSMASAAQATSAGAGALEGTRKWFARTGNLAQEAVSKPLNAIGKIWEGMSPADTRQGSEDGSGGEGERERERGEGGEAERGVVPRDVFGSRRFRASTPESPSRRPIFGDEGISRTGTPSSDMLPDFSALDIQSTIDASQETYAQTRLANVQTLHQMFPALDEEIVEAVLEGCSDDLGLAIDRLLEM
ncbi:Hypothetical protein CGB_G3250C [Cryptococcus gattii WM276]|uniref:Vacuolar protein sorting-associated protein 9 n=2 Tax=Cryptococcus gattii TaxID=37769 RepID=E6R9F1_CRYGW|nr:guanine nucleotide exchange factor VPS9 CGB_G3250C [Cryptococcus gattii WM276]ADV23481.1 Hypothetical protein CGB_G3250C [Cryptococcus gattii WM276]KIR77536.1 vacuolar protein sorting-associated protein 9 [Cryptococcus gattii EJB2]